MKSFLIKNLGSLPKSTGKLFWPRLINQPDMVDICQRGGAKLPMIFKKEDEEVQRKMGYESFLEMKSELNGECFGDDGNPHFWSALYRNDKNEWVNVGAEKEPTTFKPEGQELDEKCSTIRKNRVMTMPCEGKSTCGICAIPKNHFFYLKGLCKRAQKFFDVVYYIHEIKNQAPHFMGLSRSHIFFNQTSRSWILESLADPLKKIETKGDLSNNIPMGRGKFMFGTEICPTVKEKIQPLTFSKCFSSQFTCDSGHCISLSQRCDINVDCLD